LVRPASEALQKIVASGLRPFETLGPSSIRLNEAQIRWFNSIVKRWPEVEKERDDALAAACGTKQAMDHLCESYRAEIVSTNKEVVALQAEVQRLHDILGRAGVSFVDPVPEPEEKPMPANAIRSRRQDIGLRTP
jgi:hypothetical protein